MSQSAFTAEDLYLHAMQLLEPEESERLEEFLHRSSEARTELLHVNRDIALLALSVELKAPSATALPRLMNQIAREKRVLIPAAQADPVLPVAAARSIEIGDQDRYTPGESALPGPVYEDTQPQPSFFERLFPWVGWAIAAGLGFTTWTYHQRASGLGRAIAGERMQATEAEHQLLDLEDKYAQAKLVLETLRSPAAQRFLLTAQGTAPAPSARVSYLAETGSVVFQGNDLEKLPTAKTYELWLIPADKAAKPVPAGTFKPDAAGYASVILPALPKGLTAATFGVTVEDEGGSATPTLPIVLVGA